MKVSRHVHPSDDRAAVHTTKILGLQVRQDKGRGETGTWNPPHISIQGVPKPMYRMHSIYRHGTRHKDKFAVDTVISRQTVSTSLPYISLFVLSY